MRFLTARPEVAAITAYDANGQSVGMLGAGGPQNAEMLTFCATFPLI